MRKTFTMTKLQHAALMNACRPVPAMWIGGPPRSVQQNANYAWCSLGREMGFDGMTVRPAGHELEFTAEEAPITQPAPRPAGEVEYESWIAALGVAVGATSWVEEVRELLGEVYRFQSTSPRAQEHINAALELIDKNTHGVGGRDGS